MRRAGHALDDASAALVQRLVAAGEACAVIGVRSDETPPDALTALSKDERCASLALEPLSRGDTERLLAAGLGGPVDRRSATRCGR